LVETVEDITVVVLNEKQVDASYFNAGALFVGCAGLGDDDEPIRHPDFGSVTIVTTDGQSQTRRLGAPRKSTAPRFGKWQQARLDELLNGTAELFKPIDGPQSFEALGNDFGYGWYRLSTRGTTSGDVLAPESGDRLHLYGDGKLLALLGRGEGAEYAPVKLSLKGDLVVLADNLGRFNVGWALGERKGLFGDLYTVKRMSAGKPKLQVKPSPDPFELHGFVSQMRHGDRMANAHAAVWQFRHTSTTPLVLDVVDSPVACMLTVNEQPIGLFDRRRTAGTGRFVLTQDGSLKRGNNTVELGFFGTLPEGTDPADLVRFHRTSKVPVGEWAFARWQPPASDEFGPLRKTGLRQPTWYRSSFNVSATDQPLWFEPTGLTKGQIFLNGHNVGRYFVATATGKAVPPQTRYYLPEAWLKTDGPNELMVFEEHGKTPDKCRLVYDPMGPYGR
jgi:hypothetical protein